MARLSVLGLGLVFPLLVSARPSSAPEPPPEQEIVVTGQRLPIVVDGKAAHCRPFPNDPQDKANASPHGSARRQSVLMPVYGGRRFELVPWGTGQAWSQEFFDFNRYGGPGVWRRTGTGIDQYIFRNPKDAAVLCIGSKWSAPEGFGQIDQLVDATPYHGKRIRFTAWVASRNTSIVNFYLASGNPDTNALVLNGGNTNTHRWGGSHGWTPMMIEIGPVSKRATFISFGFVLNGDGDVWLYNPKLQPVEPGDAYQRIGDVFVIGSDSPTADASARR